MIAAVFIFAGIGSLIAMFIGWMLMPADPAPQDVRMRVAISDDIVIIGVKAGDDVTFIQIQR